MSAGLTLRPLRASDTLRTLWSSGPIGTLGPRRARYTVESLDVLCPCDQRVVVGRGAGIAVLAVTGRKRGVDHRDS